MKISPNLYGRIDGSKFWCFPWFPENSLLCVILRYRVYLGSIWYCSEPSGVPYSPNQFLALDFFCRFLQQDGFNFLYECWIWQTKTSFVSVDWKLENSNYNNFYIVQYNPMKLCLFAFRGKRMMFALRMRASVIIYNLKTWGQKCALSKFP